ncbi:acyl-CoA N-acyltransferase [Podospora australis]|uniref:Acyl-CoA N-acyltransferase n=1 Tax=Podospora australis TaxID=1536484 RepID=A0AAN7ADQ9_9PEZI|nr:acyl-CoA N-acyltransferase [Podospora australis]
MEQITAKFSKAFRSQRLIYRAVEPQDMPLVSRMLWDPVNLGFGDPTLYMPLSNTVGTMIVQKGLEMSMLAVLVCLPQTQDSDPNLPGTSLRTAQETAIPIGSITLSKPIAPKTDHWRCTKLGVGIAEEHQGNGYGPEAINWALDWAFEFAGMHRVELSTASYNEKAIRMYKTLGFTEEGRKREAIYMDRKWWDMVDFGILEGDWEKVRGRGRKRDHVERLTRV